MRPAIPIPIIRALSCFCLFLVLVASREGFAEPVDASQAAIAARGWYRLRFENNTAEQPLATEPESLVTAQDARTIAVKDRTIGFAFDVPEGGCIVIVGEDELAPVLYYSHDNRLNVPGVPAAQALLDGCADAIAELAADRAKSRRQGRGEGVDASGNPSQPLVSVVDGVHARHDRE